MTSSASDLSGDGDRRNTLWASAAALALFVAPRLALAWRRETGYDEMFTLWASRKSIADLFETLRFDSGPPLHYLIVHVLHATSIHPARAISIVAAIAALFVAMAAVTRPSDRFIVGALLAAYPIHIVFSAEARAYAMCALLAGVAAVALDRWIDDGRDAMLAVACAAIVVMAYAHHYGVFFFPLPVVMALCFRRDRIMRAVMFTIGMAVLYAPVVPLLLHQLPNAVPWMALESDAERIAIASETFLRIGFDGRMIASLAIRVVSIVLLGVAACGTIRSPRARRQFVVLLVPMCGAVIGAIAGLRAYFPVKFETVLSVPAILWFFFAMPRRLRIVAFPVAFIIGAFASATLFTHSERTFEPMRVVTTSISAAAWSDTRFVATGPAFIALSLSRPTTPFPSAHAIHPSIEVPPAQLDREAARLPVPFVWVGNVHTRELETLRRHFALERVLQKGDEAAVIVRPRRV